MHVAIAGNIGSGKTTLTRLLSKHFKWQAHYEDVEDNPYLDDFYNQMERWSFNLQIYFLNSRFRQILEIRKNKKTVIQDRTIYEDAFIFAPNLHAMGLMTNRDFENYKSLFDINLSTLNYFILAIPFIVSNSILYNVLNGYGKNKIYIFFSGPFQNLILIFLVTLNFSFLSLQNVIIFYLISVFCNFVILMYFSKTIFLQPKIKIIRFLRLIKESFFLYKYYILMSLIAAFDVFLVKTIASSYELGLYVFASRFLYL